MLTFCSKSKIVHVKSKLTLIFTQKKVNFWLTLGAYVRPTYLGLL